MAGRNAYTGGGDSDGALQQLTTGGGSFALRQPLGAANHVPSPSALGKPSSTSKPLTFTQYHTG